MGIEQMDMTDTEELIDLFRIIFKNIYSAQETLETVRFLLQNIPDIEETEQLEEIMDKYCDFFSSLLETRNKVVYPHDTENEE